MQKSLAVGEWRGHSNVFGGTWPTNDPPMTPTMDLLQRMEFKNIPFAKISSLSNLGHSGPTTWFFGMGMVVTCAVSLCYRLSCLKSFEVLWLPVRHLSKPCGMKQNVDISKANQAFFFKCMLRLIFFAFSYWWWYFLSLCSIIKTSFELTSGDK